MKTRLLAALGAVIVAAGVAAGTAGVASAATPMDCANAMTATANAQNAYNTALSVAIARAKELGFTADQVSLAQMILAQGNITDAQKQQLMMIYSEHASMVDVATDLPKVKAVLDTRLALNAAQAAQNIACAGMMTAPANTTPTTTMPAPANVTPAPAATSGALPMVMPQGAPKTGDGSTVGR